MKPFISTSFFGVINWACSILLLTSPWFLEYYKVGGVAFLLPTLFGWLLFIMAVFIDNKLGFFKQFPLQMHLFLAVIMGSFLLASPFVYGFSDKVFWPHLLLGGMLFLAGIFTKGSPFLTVHNQMPEGQLTSTDSEEGRLTH
jgi:hypothetical protein